MKKHLKYAWYVLRHRWFVFVECVRLGIPWRGLVHDLSKFLPDEWFPYVEFFYGAWKDRGETLSVRVLAAFNAAWLRHQHRNPHHWQYWRLREDDGGTKLLPMPEKYVREMLADWRGAGRAQGFDKLGPWYEKNHRMIELERETRALLHSLMTYDELPKEQPIEVLEKVKITAVSLNPDGSMTIEGRSNIAHLVDKIEVPITAMKYEDKKDGGKS